MKGWDPGFKLIIGKNKHSTRTGRRKNNSRKKYEDNIRNLWDISKHIRIQIIETPEGEEKEQEMENFFEKIIKRKLP